MSKWRGYVNYYADGHTRNRSRAKPENTNINCSKNYEHERDGHGNIATRIAHREQVDIQAKPGTIPIHVDVKRSLVKTE